MGEGGKRDEKSARLSYQSEIIKNLRIWGVGGSGSGKKQAKKNKTKIEKVFCIGAKKIFF